MVDKVNKVVIQEEEDVNETPTNRKIRLNNEKISKTYEVDVPKVDKTEEEKVEEKREELLEKTAEQTKEAEKPRTFEEVEEMMKRATGEKSGKTDTVPTQGYTLKD